MKKVAIIVVRHRFKVLVAQKRSKYLAPNGLPPWVFPGGTFKPSETPEEAARRELFEETSGSKELVGLPLLALGQVHDEPRQLLLHIFATLVPETVPPFLPPPHHEFFDAFKWIKPAYVDYNEMMPGMDAWFYQAAYAESVDRPFSITLARS